MDLFETDSMAQIVVKTEVQPNGDILLFYLNEQEDQDINLLDPTEAEQVNDKLHILPDTKYVVEDFVDEDSPDEQAIAEASEDVSFKLWQEDELKRLLTFYIDNKETFLSGTTRKIHLWAVACKTMLMNKQPISCEAKLLDLKKKYAQLFVDKEKGMTITWPFFDLCHEAFHDDNYVKMYINESSEDKVVINMPMQSVVNKDGVLMVKKVNSGQTKDEKVETMLNLYIQHKKYFQKNHNVQKGIWESIALNLGEEDVDYWHKRFLNFKQHYIRMLYKRKECGPDSINWPYMAHFDQIFADDMDFQNKFFPKADNKSKFTLMVESGDSSWNETEKTFLVKYCFDCFHEFQDPTIPKKFHWQEVGRLLDKKPETCKKKYEELKDAHFYELVSGGYSLSQRIPLAILFDNIIAKESEIEIEKNNGVEFSDSWTTEQTDELVNYLYENLDMLKDSVCYYVCWGALAKKLSRPVSSCKKQWDDLTTLYKSVLNDKKEYPDMQINWRYIDLFDRIFDYGMDTNLLDGYKKMREKTQINKSGKVAVKKVTIKDSNESLQENCTDDEEVYDERGFTKRSKKRSGDTKAFKILEYYFKNKDKFSSSQYKKLALWEVLARQIGIPASECAHRFRNFKQVYTGYVQREINKPEMPILWPYYTLCKKVFGYRAIKSKLKNGKIESDDAEDWSAKEIKQLIKYFASNYYNLIDKVEDKSKWTTLARDIGRSETSCFDKFVELRKSYRKLKTMKARNPDVKVSWKYFNMIDDIYKSAEEHVSAAEQMEVVEDPNSFEVIKTETSEDDEFQCIIVIPEGEDMNNAQIIIQEKDQPPEVKSELESKQITTKWNRRSKTRLLNLYLKYLKTHVKQEINITEMWTDIASKLDEKTPITCKKMFIKLKNQHRQLLNENIKTPYYNLLEKILAFRPKFAKTAKNQDLDKITVFKDVQMSDDKVYNALNYYLQNLEDFVSPKFEHKYLWNELAKFISEPVVKVYHKINYLKQMFNSHSEMPFKEILQEILSKENALRDILSNDQNLSLEEEEVEEPWSDIETERLLTWYLAHLDKFKNPKFVRSYLWMEASDILKKSPLVCSKKMCEIRSQYRTMVKDNPEELKSWKFYNLCQRIYGTGKKSCTSTNN